MLLNHIKKDLQKQADPDRANILLRFFKTGKGEYGEGDWFLGIPVPEQRRIAKKYKALPLQDLQELISSKIHEYRLVALLILILQYAHAHEQDRGDIVKFYLENTRYINNWDLVDLSAEKILGTFLLANERAILWRLAESPNLWERRIAVISTFAFIRQNQFEDTFRLAEMLLRDPHDLIHKAVGWMLREIGKRDQESEERFLREHSQTMPRTMLRYAIERFEQEKRTSYLGKIQ
ncbi:MAG: DNA alkylation repair protein [Thermodesulfovibrionales bacterium]|nr:DNA alkylation repair protein [Thermodesulfovibrionales bacterium]